MNVKFSIILPVFHGGGFLRKALSSLGEMAWPEGGVEIIVAGKKAMLNDPSLIDNDLPAFLQVSCEGNRSEALNAACAVARGSVWAFADDDCVFPNDWLVNIERFLTGHPDVAAMGGVDALVDHAGVFDLALDEALNSLVGTGGLRRTGKLSAGRYYPRLWNMAVMAHAAKTAAIAKPEGMMIFDPSLGVHEDVDLVERIRRSGGKVRFAPDVRIGHCRDTTFMAYVVRNFHMAGASRRLGTHRTAHLALAALAVGLPLSAVASVFAPSLIPIVVSVAAVYLTALALAGLKGALNKKHAILVLLIPALIVALHASRSIGYLFAWRQGQA